MPYLLKPKDPGVSSLTLPNGIVVGANGVKVPSLTKKEINTFSDFVDIQEIEDPPEKPIVAVEEVIPEGAVGFEYAGLQESIEVSGIRGKWVPGKIRYDLNEEEQRLALTTGGVLRRAN